MQDLSFEGAPLVARDPDLAAGRAVDRLGQPDDRLLEVRPSSPHPARLRLRFVAIIPAELEMVDRRLRDAVALVVAHGHRAVGPDRHAVGLAEAAGDGFEL